MQSLEEMIEILDSEECNPIRYGDTPYQRHVQFYAVGVECHIEWYANLATLKIGGKYVCYIGFDNMEVDKTWPSYWRGLRFTENGDYRCNLALELLDWQK